MTARAHHETFSIIGFCDVVGKSRGTADITYFAAGDCFTAEHIPSKDEMREYAKDRGYWPSNKPGSTETKCDPVYLVGGGDHSYVTCPQCFRPAIAVDNRPAPGA
jgi:hypothetical protein